jgi:acetyl esterase
MLIQFAKVRLLRSYYLMSNRWNWRRQAPTGVAVSDHRIEGPGGQITLRTYRPAAQPVSRVIVYFHGGGWVIGGLETHHPFCQQLCAKAKSEVIAVDYRLAPEHPFPAAVDDCRAALAWIRRRQAGPEAASLYVAGDSAGGNLAAVVARNEPGIHGQILIYPVTAHYDKELPSYEENASGYGLTRKLMTWFWDTYLGSAAAKDAARHELAAPLDWDSHSSLPAALVVTAGLDPLRDEGELFAEKLKQAGTDCTHLFFENAMHGFVCSEGLNTNHRTAMLEMVNWLDYQQGLQ